MNRKLLQNLFYEKANKTDDQYVSLGYNLYGYELFADKPEDLRDVEPIKNMVEKTSPVLEKLYHLQEEDGSVASLSSKDEDDSSEMMSYLERIYSTSVFIAVMCTASRIYEELDPVFSRDLIHAALEAGHYLMVSQFPKEENERISVERMSSRDDELGAREKLAVMWAFSELARTDLEVRNAYDHSMMAGMPQKMNRQKRYKIRLNTLTNNLLIFDSDTDVREISDIAGEYDENLLLFTLIPALMDETDSIPSNYVKIAEKTIYKLADDVCDKGMSRENVPFIIIGMLHTELLLKKNESEKDKDSQLIKVIEYNVIGDNGNSLTKEDINRLTATINLYNSQIESLMQ